MSTQLNKKQRILLGSVGLVILIEIVFYAQISQTVNLPEPVYSYHIILALPIALIFILTTIIPPITYGVQKINNFIKSGLLAPLDRMSVGYWSFVICGGMLGFAITTFICIYSFDWILNVFSIVPPNITENVGDVLNTVMKNDGSGFITVFLLLPLSGYAVLIIYKLINIGTIWTTEKSTIDSNDVKYFSWIILVVIVLGLITYADTRQHLVVQNIDNWGSLLLLFTPVMTPSGMAVIMISLFVTRGFIKLAFHV